MQSVRPAGSLSYLMLAILAIALLASLGSATRAEANTDPSCIAKEQAAGPCKDMPYGPTYYIKNGKCSTTGPGQTKPGYIGAPCKESDGTAFSVGGKCVPGAKCLCETCKADGDKGGMPPMLPMLPMPMMMPSMDMPMPMQAQPCPAVPTTHTTSTTTETTPIVRTVIIDGVATTATTSRSTTTPVTTTTTAPSRDCLCQQNPYAAGCEASGTSGLLNGFGGSGSVWQNSAFTALDTLGSVANSVAGTVINGAANAIETLTGIDIDTGFTNPGPTSIVVSPTNTSVNTEYAQATYSGASPVSVQGPGPQYAYDADTTQYGAFSGQAEDPSFMATWTQALSGVLTQLGQAISTLFDIL